MLLEFENYDAIPNDTAIVGNSKAKKNITVINKVNAMLASASYVICPADVEHSTRASLATSFNQLPALLA